MSEKYYKEEIARIDRLLESKKELIFCASLESQGLKMLRKNFEEELEKLRGK
ncbi:hypothetical protein HB825_05510 [Listeria booriae]|uniref:hypothetical protein n=1 Tax=Listeria booriae TaxID=1552123 RepID=UPI0016286538|nr:hypothetical protein [Listeria booriae]MBC1524823.1 hypothetical protein [Listeria booriae]MBC6134294.1 hypothetical protein [Listeria booriae]